MNRGMLVILLGSLVAAGCSNSKLRRTPTAERATPWFCEMDESRNDWECVQNAELARNPKPKRLPGDEPEELPTVEFDLPPRQEIQSPDPAVDAASGDLVPPTSESEATTGLQPTTDREPAPPLAGAAEARSSGEPGLLSLPADYQAVQLVAVANARLADEFISEHGLTDAIHLQLGRDGSLYHVVLLGVYESYREAQTAAQSRSTSLADIEPWIRPLNSIQDGLREAGSLLADGKGAGAAPNRNP